MLKKPGADGADAGKNRRKKKVRIRTESGELVETTDSYKRSSTSIFMRVTDRGIFVVPTESDGGRGQQQQQQLSSDGAACDGVPGGFLEPPSGYGDDLDSVFVPDGVGNPGLFLGPSPGSVPDDPSTVRWRDPDLHEVIQFLSHHNNMVKANACAYLQHLCYMDNAVKQKTRALGGILPLVQLLGHRSPDVHRNACGALRNLSYGRENDENKRCIMNCGGVPMLVHLLRATADTAVSEVVTGTLWNLSSCEELKRPVIDDALAVLVNRVVVPCSGCRDAARRGPPPPPAFTPPALPGDPAAARALQSPPPTPTSCLPDLYLSTVFRNAAGVLRNVSSAGEYARKKMRECDGLVEALLHVVKTAVGKCKIDNKSVENCVCVLRNLSYRCQEIEDPEYDKVPNVRHGGGCGNSSSRPVFDDGVGTSCGDEKGRCFGGNKKKKEGSSVVNNGGIPAGSSGHQQLAGDCHSNVHHRGAELLWQPEVVQLYLSLLSECSNPETLEASAGAIQNLSACYWKHSLEIRAAVRKEKGLPILVELLRMEVDRVVCAVATALRNLAIDERNKELIGKYAMRDLVQKLPSRNPQEENCWASNDTLAAVLATLNEVIKKHAEFARSLFECGGVERLVNITRQKRSYNPRVIKFSSQVLYTMWQHQELRDVYKSAKWKESDFVTKTSNVQKGSKSGVTNGHGSPGSCPQMEASGGPGSNSTLNRPMASQGATRYEDCAVHRRQQQPSQFLNRLS